jgi:hypothetical protein
MNVKYKDFTPLTVGIDQQSGRKEIASRHCNKQESEGCAAMPQPSLIFSIPERCNLALSGHNDGSACSIF